MGSFERIISVFSSSRSGSSLLHHVFSQHPEIWSLAGEDEVHYKFCNQGWPFDSDDAWDGDPIKCRASIEAELFGTEIRRLFQELDIEEKPFVDWKSVHVGTNSLVLKTPQNCYRRHFIPQMYPNSKVIEVTIRRPIQEIVNGLLDGWVSPDFKSRRIDDFWWSFDMPPGWDLGMPLCDRCLHQCLSGILYSYETDWTFEHPVTLSQINEFYEEFRFSRVDNISTPLIMGTSKRSDRWKTSQWRTLVDSVCSTSSLMTMIAHIQSHWVSQKDFNGVKSKLLDTLCLI